MITSDACGSRRSLNVDSPNISGLECVQWWLERQRDYPLKIIATFNDTKSLVDIPASERFSQQLCEKPVAHSLNLTIEGVKSLRSFATLLQQTGEVILRQCELAFDEAGRLRTLELSKRTDTVGLDPLVSCSNLTSVIVEFCHFAPPESLRRLRNMRELVIRGCTGTNVDFLKECMSLESVDVSGCTVLTTLSGLNGLRNLKVVIPKGVNITEICCLAGCTALETVDVSYCEGLTTLSGLNGLRNLKRVNASRTSITDIGALAGCVALERVDVRYCRGLTSVLPLSGMQNLTEITVERRGVNRSEESAFKPGVFVCGVDPPGNVHSVHTGSDETLDSEVEDP
ncbi:hypothetical protein AGDE_13789 [Angomonas deanei]|uniref:Leucine Rich repeat n=1 Tax=Angomonas deanei TaxID=59799 RepID=A0A7G2CSW9_9TRYP|nr:hypothetical protein AGDE_13789 [Angomonas deanei]CAD2222878.1 hypothetical protein, conserved [Angomonas deanei]|eukprot:EPY21733.1 hypothetical protein AGDE_13789 [Angomonas deanei]